MKSSKTSFLRNCISGWNVRSASGGAKRLFTRHFFVSSLTSGMLYTPQNTLYTNTNSYNMIRTITQLSYPEKS